MGIPIIRVHWTKYERPGQFHTFHYNLCILLSLLTRAYIWHVGHSHNPTRDKTFSIKRSLSYSEAGPFSPSQENDLDFYRLVLVSSSSCSSVFNSLALGEGPLNPYQKQEGFIYLFFFFFFDNQSKRAWVSTVYHHLYGAASKLTPCTQLDKPN